MRMGTEIKDSIWVLYTCGVQISWRWRQLGGKSKNRLNWEISSGGKKRVKNPWDHDAKKWRNKCWEVKKQKRIQERRKRRNDRWGMRGTRRIWGQEVHEGNVLRKSTVSVRCSRSSNKIMAETSPLDWQSRGQGWWWCWRKQLHCRGGSESLIGVD